MKKIALFLQLVVLIYFVLFVIFFFSFDALGPAFNMDPLTPESMLTVFLFGLVLFLLAWAAGTLHRNKLVEENGKLQTEMNALKARLYDFEHPKVAPVAKVAPPRVQEDQQANLRPRQNFTD